MIKSAAMVGQTIKDERNKLKLTQEQLAAKLQISSQAVSKWEKGESYPDIQQIGSLCREFGITMDELMNENIETVNQKKMYRIFEKIELSSCKIEILNIIKVDQSRIQIQMSIYNNSNVGVTLKTEYFLLLDNQGNMAEASVKNVSNYDGDVIRTELLHKIPSFIPSKSQVQVTLVFNEIRKDAQLWLNIPNLISDAYYILRYSVYCLDQELYNMNLTKDDLVDIYNYMFVTGNVTRREQLPKISNEIIDDIVVDKTSAFFKKHSSLFDPKIIEEVASKDEYVNWKFLTDNVKEPERLRESVKKNFSNIEKECEEGKCYIVGTNNVQEYMDQEIINFVIKLTIRHVRRYKDWILEQINDDNIHLFKEEITKLSYLINLELFKSKASSKIINQYIRESDIKDVQPFRVSKYKSYFNEAFEQETVDVLLKDVEVDTLETLTKFRKILSREEWNIKKNEFFEKEHEKVDQLKLQIEKELD